MEIIEDNAPNRENIKKEISAGAKKENMAKTRIALIGIILDTRESVGKLNRLLSQYGQYVIGRMGIPYREKDIHVISVALDAPNNIISTLSGKLGMLPGVSTKTIYGKSL